MSTGIILAFVWFGIIGVAVLWAIYKLLKDLKNEKRKL
jgi:putative flippase GtrA